MSTVTLSIIPLANCFSVFALTGIIWLVQLNLYPLFLKFPLEQNTDFFNEHGRTITFVVAPLMFLDLGTSTYLLFTEEIQHNQIFFGFLFSVFTWISTFFIQVPLHEKLLRKPDIITIQKLIQTNWIRTIAWSSHSVLILYRLSL